MNPFALLESDDEEEVVKVTTKDKKNNAKPDNAPLTEKSSSGRGNKGGRGHGKSGRGTREGKREFDRHSGTGRGKEVSKGGAGKGNWGNEKAEALEAEKRGDAADVEENNEEEVDNTPVEPEKPTFTMDEYLARRSAPSNPDVFGTKQARQVDSSFAGMKSAEVDLSDYIASKGDNSVKSKKEAKTKDVVRDLGIRTEPASVFREDRGPRGGRGEGRGEGRGRSEGRGRGRGGEGRGRGKPSAANKIDVTDNNAFPVLAK